MSFDGEKWRKFQDEALNSLMLESEANTVFQIKVVNSFAPSVTWQIAKTSHGGNEETYFAEFRRWRSDVDQEKFRSPVELLKHLGSLRPTIETERFELDIEFLKDSLNRLYSINISPFIEEKAFGLDGSTTEIQFGGKFLNSSFSWWNSPPAEWKELGDIVTEILNQLDSKVSL